MINDKSRLIIRKASAGAGKTFTLVKEYLKLAFTGPESSIDKQFSHILAITFTNKAANEMKVRIMKELTDIADKGPDSKMAQAIYKDLNDGQKHETISYLQLQNYAARVKSAILHRYSDLSVCTIDSFMHRIVRTFAHDLNLPMNFEVVLDDSDLIQTSVDDLMALAGQEGEEELTRTLSAYADAQMEDGKSFNIAESLADLAGELFKEGTSEQLEKLKDIDLAGFTEIRKRYRHDNETFENSIRAIAQKAVDEIAAGGLGTEDFYRGKNGIGGYFAQVAKGEIKLGNSYVDEFVKGNKLAAGKASKETIAAVTAIKPSLIDHYTQIANAIDTGLALYNTRTNILKNLYSMAVLNRLNDLIRNESMGNEMLHISEFNKQISDVVQKEPMPFIYERVGSKYNYILIDEFQDTSKQQWQNLLPLVDNAVGGGHTCLIVGDGKQAIYRFRKGDVKQFVDLPHVESEFHGAIFESPQVADADTLPTNFRTRANVVEFNNKFYEWIAKQSNAEIQKIYLGANDAAQAELIQLPATDKVGGYVQVEFHNTKEEGNDPLWKAMLADIRHQVNDLGYSYGDITILGRDKKVLSGISSYLAMNPDGGTPIPMVSSESFLLKNSRLVMLIRAALYYLLDNRNRPAAAQVLQLLSQMGITHYDYTQELAKEDPAKKYLVDLTAILAHDDIEFNAERLRSLTLYDCCEELIRTFRLQGIEISYTASLLNVAASYSKSHRQDLAEFLEWFDKKLDTLSSNTAGEQDAISLMTIHKSKGLESKIILYAIPSSRTKPNTIWVDFDDETTSLKTSLVTAKQGEATIYQDQVEEEKTMCEMDDLNVLYVATTRPKHKIMIYCAQPSATSTDNSYAKLLSDYVVLGDSDPLASEWKISESESRSIYSIGDDIFYIDETEEERKAKEAAKPRPEMVSNLTFAPWDGRVEIAKQAQKIFDTATQERIQQGNVIHEVLAMMKSIDDAGSAIEQYAATNNLDPDTTHNIELLITNIMRQEECAKFFDPRYPAINENDMVINGEIRRPDRIVLADDETWVVDFKTGASDNEYKTQVANYCEAIRQMGYPHVKGYLLYIRRGRCQVEEV